MKRGIHFSVSNHEAAQALKLIRALREVLDELTAELARVEGKAAMTRSKGMASAIRSEAAALRRDISEAQALIDRLRNRYINGDHRTDAARF